MNFKNDRKGRALVVENVPGERNAYVGVLEEVMGVQCVPCGDPLSAIEAVEQSVGSSGIPFSWVWIDVDLRSRDGDGRDVVDAIRREYAPAGVPMPGIILLSGTLKLLADAEQIADGFHPRALLTKRTQTILDSDGIEVVSVMLKETAAKVKQELALLFRNMPSASPPVDPYQLNYNAGLKQMEVVWEGSAPIRMPATMGMRFIRILLMRKDQKIPAETLYALAAGAQPLKESPGILDAGLNIAGQPDPGDNQEHRSNLNDTSEYVKRIIDNYSLDELFQQYGVKEFSVPAGGFAGIAAARKAIHALKKRVNELQENYGAGELDLDDPAKQAELNDTLRRLHEVNPLLSEFERRLGPAQRPNHRPMESTRKAIHRARQFWALAPEGSAWKCLATHLDKPGVLTGGTNWQYRPRSDTTWDIDMDWVSAD